MLTHKYKILIIEDEKQIQKLLEISLPESEFNIKICGTIKDGLTTLNAMVPDVVLLDLGLPDGDGKDAIAKIKALSKSAVIIVSARNSENEIVSALDLGADDYLIKPFFVRELIARINSTMRRLQKQDSQSQIITTQDFELNLERREIKINNEALNLTPIEYNLLKFFILNCGKALTHNQILKEVWGLAYKDDTKILRVYVNQLRKKIEINTNKPQKLITISGVGYRFY